MIFNIYIIVEILNIKLAKNALVHIVIMFVMRAPDI